MWCECQMLWARLQSQMMHMDRQDWMLTFVVLVVLGSYCLRGFGSRTGY